MPSNNIDSSMIYYISFSFTSSPSLLIITFIYIVCGDIAVCFGLRSSALYHPCSWITVFFEIVYKRRQCFAPY